MANHVQKSLTGRALSFSPVLLVLILAGPVIAGFIGTLAPAFGYLPALGGEALSLEPFSALFAEPGIWMSIWLSFITGFMATLLAVASVFLFISAYVGTPAFTRIEHFLSPLLSIPHASAAFGLGFLIAPSGLVFRAFSPWLTGVAAPPDLQIINDPLGLSMIVALAIKEIPFLLLMSLAALRQIPVSLARREMSSLGFGRMSGFFIASASLLYAQIRLPVLAVLAFSVSVVDVAIILGPQLPSTLAVRISVWMADPDLQNRFLGSAGAIVQMLVLGAAIILWLGLEWFGRRVVLMLADKGARLLQDRAARFLSITVMIISGLLVIAGMLSLGFWSVAGLWPFPLFLPETLTFSVWMRTLPHVGGPLLTTLLVAGTASLLSLILVVLVFWGRQVSGKGRSGAVTTGLIYLPLLVPQLGFVFGLQVLLLSAGIEPGLLSLIFVHLIFVLPYVFLSLNGPWEALDPRYEQLAMSFGISKAKVLLSVRLPLLSKPLMTALAVGLAVSIGLYLPTVLIGAGRLTTITTEAVALSSGGDRRVIGVYALVQAILPFAGFWVASMIPRLLQPRHH